MRIRRLLPFSLLTSLLVLPFGLQAQQNYNIPSTSLNEALLRLADQAGIQIIFPADLVRNRQSRAVEGLFNIEQALQQLIADPDIQFRSIDAQTITLFITHTNTASEIITTLEPVIINGQAIKHTEPTKSNNRYQSLLLNSATATSTPIKALPQSVHSLNRALLDDQQTVNLSDSLNNVSGVTTRDPWFTPVVEGTLIRGFRAEQLLDGFTQYYNPGDREGMVNIDSIEVLKGANALIYGGGSGSPAGGVINLNSKKPQALAFQEVGFKAGSYDFYQPYVDVNQPLNDKIWFRFTGEYTQSGSQIDVIETQRYNLNPALTLSNGSNTQLTLQGKISHWQQPEYQGLPATGTLTGDFRIPRSTFIGPTDIPDSQSQSDAIWASFSHHLDSTWSINLKGRYSDSEFSEHTQSLVGRNFSLVADVPYSDPSTWLLANGTLHERQQELSFMGHALAEFEIGITRNKLLIGADHSALTDAGFLTFQAISSVDLRQPQFTTPYQFVGDDLANQVVKSEVYGGYIQWQSDVDQRFHSLFGLRAAGMEMNYRNDIINQTYLTRSLKWLPRVGMSFDVNDNITVFADYTEGMRGQPFVIFASAPQPELSRQLETGIKFDWQNRLSGQFAVYQIDRYQAPIASTPSSIAYHAQGQQRAQGYEADLNWQIIDGLNLLANYAYNRTQFVTEQFGVPTGNTLPRTPDHSGRFWLNYRLPNPLLQGVSLGFGVYANSGAYLSNDNAFRTPSFHSFDSSIAYETGDLKLSASIKNLSNEQYFLPFSYIGGGAQGGGRLSPASNVSFYLGASYRF